MLGRRWRTGGASSPARSFDPNRVGTWEWRAWAAYYRRQWVAVLVASVGLVHAGFGMSWRRTLRGAWLVLRANQRWAPVPDNDPDGARRLMERFFRLVAQSESKNLDLAEAARPLLRVGGNDRPVADRGGSHKAVRKRHSSLITDRRAMRLPHDRRLRIFRGRCVPEPVIDV